MNGKIKYYISEVRKANIEVRKGVLEYPKMKQTKEVVLTDDDENKLNDAVQHIRTIASADCPPVIPKGICKKCSYYEFCYSGEE